VKGIYTLYDTIIEWSVPLSAVLVGVIIGSLITFWFSKRTLAGFLESRQPMRGEQFVATEEERSALRSVVGEMRLNALMVDETAVIWSWAPFERRAIDNAQWLYPNMPPVVAEAVARANRKVTEYNSIAEFANSQDHKVQAVAQEARTSLVIASQRLEEYLTEFQMEQGRRGLRIPRTGNGKSKENQTSDWYAT
jgi:hypothetical protein